MVPRYLADLFQNFATIIREMKGIQAPVVGVCSSLQESPLLKIVEYRHQAAGMNLQFRCEFLLAQAGSSAQQAQDARIRRCEFEDS